MTSTACHVPLTCTHRDFPVKSDRHTSSAVSNHSSPLDKLSLGLQVNSSPSLFFFSLYAPNCIKIDIANYSKRKASENANTRQLDRNRTMGCVSSNHGHPLIPDEAVVILKSLAAQWSDITDANDLEVVPLKGAMTNEVYQIRWVTNNKDQSLPRSRKVLVRIYGEGVDVFFDRENEIRTFEFMSRKGQGPRLLGRFPNGRIEEFIRARTLSAADLRDPEISALIASKMKEFHNLDMPGSKTVVLWDRLRNWLKEAKRLATEEEAEAFCLNSMEDEISGLEKNLATECQMVGFCHNDLQYGNIMMDEETKSLTIIDYEYASYNHVAFDIANHFCEMAADYHTETPHILDYIKYPDLEERRRFIHIYLSNSGNQPSDSEEIQLIRLVEKYTLASHLLWGLWGIISEHVNKIDFDYMEYARQRFQQYRARKSEVLEFSSSTEP